MNDKIYIESRGFTRFKMIQIIILFLRFLFTKVFSVRTLMRVIVHVTDETSEICASHVFKRVKEKGEIPSFIYIYTLRMRWKIYVLFSQDTNHRIQMSKP